MRVELKRNGVTIGWAEDPMTITLHTRENGEDVTVTASMSLVKSWLLASFDEAEGEPPKVKCDCGCWDEKPAYTPERCPYHLWDDGDGQDFTCQQCGAKVKE